ncbi:hypothetical protein ACN42_g8744 [Penicillium freii]|uniref:Uncharacterized protein n=1 Tax=Penicillium freii TaxID=48697 RepID=A0A101MD89_PENFR|nr:hypothetical protein ACN42_g8744 [Penicillium freii]
MVKPSKSLLSKIEIEFSFLTSSTTQQSISHCTMHFDIHHVDLTGYEPLEALFNLSHRQLHPSWAPPSTPPSSSSLSPSVTIDIAGQATPTNTYKQSQHTLTEGFSHRVFIPQNKRASPTMHLSIRYPRSQFHGSMLGVGFLSLVLNFFNYSIINLTLHHALRRPSRSPLLT